MLITLQPGVIKQCKLGHQYSNSLHSMPVCRRFGDWEADGVVPNLTCASSMVSCKLDYASQQSSSVSGPRLLAGLIQLIGQLTERARVCILLADIKPSSSCEANVADAAIGLW